MAAENAVRRFKRMDYTVIPHCIFSVPEVAAVGLTEEEARQQGHNVMAATFPLTSSEKAIIEGEIEGMVKIITAEGRRQSPRSTRPRRRAVTTACVRSLA